MPMRVFENVGDAKFYAGASLIAAIAAVVWRIVSGTWVIASFLMLVGFLCAGVAALALRSRLLNTVVLLVLAAAAVAVLALPDSEDGGPDRNVPSARRTS